MNTDYRVHIGFFTHLKTRHVNKEFGPGGVLGVLKLWEYTALNRPNGVLRGLTAGDVDAVCDQKEGFAELLIVAGFVDRDEDGTLCVHNWAERNSWAAGADERSRRARYASEERWRRDAESKRAELDRLEGAVPTQTYATSNAPSIDEQCPSPLLSFPSQSSPSSIR